MPARTVRRRTWIIAIAAALVAVLLVWVAVAAAGREDAALPSASPSPDRPAPSPTPTPTPERAPTTAGVVTSQPLATQAAVDVLADGGTAADAAFAAAAVLSVVEPYYSNLIGGETAALHYDGETGEIVSLEAVGPVGAEFDLGAYRAAGTTGYGLYQSIVPAAWAGWMAVLEAEGTLDLPRLLEPAIVAARDGFTATPEHAAHFDRVLQWGATNAAARDIFAPGGGALPAGSLVVQGDLADTLQRIADVAGAEPERADGIAAAHDEVYAGEVGASLLAAAREGGASFTADDLAATTATLEEAISVEYSGHTVHQNPPTSQGVTMLTALNTLRSAELTPENRDAPETQHTMIEAMKLALADREAYVGDPAFTDVPVAELLDPAYGERQFSRIDPGASLSWPTPPGLDENTTTLQVVDGDGNAFAATTSIGYQLVIAGDTGIAMNARLSHMTADDPSSPNAIEPGKLVRYTGNPYLITDDDGLRYLGGNISGDSQAQVQMQHIVGVLDFGLTPQEALERYRFVSQSHPNGVSPHAVRNRVVVENTMPQAVIDGLRERGQTIAVQQLGAEPFPFGFGSMIRIDDGGDAVEFGTDPRIDGSTGELLPPS